MNLELAEQVKKLRLEDKSSVEIKKILNISQTTLSKYSKFAQESLMTEDERIKVKELDTLRHRNSITTQGVEGDKNSYSYLKRRNKELNEENRKYRELLQTSLDTPLAEMMPWEYGQLCEIYALYRLRRAGIRAFRPDSTSKALDIIVENTLGEFIRCEVKGCSKGSLVSISRTGYDCESKSFKTSKYPLDDKIDFFICVLLESEQIFIIPYSDTLGVGKSLTLTPQGHFFKYKDAFHLFDFKEQ